MAKDINENFENEENELDQVTLTLEDGSELVCDVIAIYPCGERNYIALLPVDDPDSDFLLYRFIDNGNDNYDLDDIETDEELEEASDAFDELLDSEEFDEMFDDEDDN